MADFTTRSDEVIIKHTLQSYIDASLDEVTEDYMNLINKENIVECLELIRKYRNVLLCIKEICKFRKNY